MGEKFKVGDNLKFWLLEQKIDVPEKKKKDEPSEYKANIWLFQEEADAIEHFSEMLGDLDLDDDDLMSRVSTNYSLQEIENTEEKLKMSVVSGLKLYIMALKALKKNT